MKQNHKTMTAGEPWYRRLRRNRSSHSIQYDGTKITITEGLNPTAKTLAFAEVVGVEIEVGILTNGLTVETKGSKSIRLNGLSKRASEALHDAVQHDIKERILDLAATAEAQALSPELTALANAITCILPAGRYIRQSQAERIVEATQKVTGRCTHRVRRKLEAHATAALQQIDEILELATDQEKRRKANDVVVDRQVTKVKTATTGLLANSLTDEQARTIATDQDVTLVLAGAGTGKTAVIIGKIAHLVRNQGVAPEAVLALAFNRKAAIEIRERLPENLKGTNVSTFHSFALKVISETGTAPSISIMAQDDFAYSKAIEQIIQNAQTDPKLARIIVDFVSQSPAEYVEPFDFRSLAEYEQHVRDNELRTFNGELVKSFEELTIANFLSQNGIKYQYEARYEHDTASSQYRQYEPDFYLPDHHIYVEHFALNKDGQPPPGWTGYAEGVKWKRALHAQHGTELLETYSWQHRNDTLLSNLEVQLRERGVDFQPVPAEDLVERLSAEKLSVLSHLLGTFLQHVKSADLSEEEVERRTKLAKDRKRADWFFQLFTHTRGEYERLLREEKAIDFHDLINQATALISKGDWDNPYQYVLVDEFQDISDGRMALAKALKKPDLAYFLVGDDWQSIYRFAGSHVGLIHECDQHLGHTERANLTRTFRFGDGILKPSSAFVQRNPEQTKRNLVANSQAGDEGITIIAADDSESGVNTALQMIRKADDAREASVLVLGRFQSSRTVLGPRRGRQSAGIEFSTVHSAKGRESDYVIVLDLVDKRYGFPCLVVDDPLLDLVAPSAQHEPYPNAEERRLFYVALTRARKGAYLIADQTNPSPFVRELLRRSTDIRTVGQVSQSCPACHRGSLTRSQSGDNLRCTNSPTCQYLAPRCPNCKEGYATVNEDSGVANCSNPDCTEPPGVCPECRTGVVVLRTNPREFWACSRYWDTPSCTFTAPYIDDGR